MTSVLLPFIAPYDWDAMLAFYAMRAITGIEVVDGLQYRRSLVIDGVQGELAVQPEGDALRAVVYGALADEILARITRAFDLATDPRAVAAGLAHDPHLAALLAARPGLRVPGNVDPYELGVRAILGQQITVVGAARLAADIVDRYGRPLESRLGLTHTFPEPHVLADADIRGMPQSRIDTLRGFARAVASDSGLFTGTPAEVVARLRGLRGIGDWTAQYIALRALRDADAFPASDIGLLRAMADSEGVRPSAKALLARAEAWRPLRAYAAQHLWAADALATVRR